MRKYPRGLPARVVRRVSRYRANFAFAPLPLLSTGGSCSHLGARRIAGAELRFLSGWRRKEFHRRRRQCATGFRRRRGVLKFLRRPVPQGRVQPLPVVVGIEELLQMRGKLAEIAVPVTVDFLLLQGLHETLARRIGRSRRLQRMPTVPKVLLKSPIPTIR